MQNAKCKMRTWKEIAIAAQSTYWCGNLRVLPRTSVQRMSLRTSAHTGVAIRFPKPSSERRGQRVKKAPNIRCHSEPVRRLVWESPG